MYCQLLLWMAIRYVTGDEIFDNIFQFKTGQFTLTQTWDEPINDIRTSGNLLYPFYDDPLDPFFGKELVSPASNPCIQTRSVFNHPAYLAKHPGGTARLANVVQIGSRCINFDPGASQVTLSMDELEQRLIHDYNAPQTPADLEKLWIYTKMPDFVHPDFAPNTFGALAEETKKLRDHNLDEHEWKKSQAEREKNAMGLQLIFNFQRLIACLEEVRDAKLHGHIGKDVFSLANLKKSTERARYGLQSLIAKLGNEG